MIECVAVGLLSFLKPTPQPQQWQPLSPARSVQVEPIVLFSAGELDYSGRMHDFGRMPPVVKEYGTPALRVAGDGITVKNFAWRGSMEGVHVGSRSFLPKEMRLPHRPIRVVLQGLFCEDIGEDCVSIQPRAQVQLLGSRFRGNYQRTQGTEAEAPGMDKILQIDGADVLIENCIFQNGATAVRAKANSRVTVRNCLFIRCCTAISGDGMANPRPGKEYDNGTPGLCQITVENCRFWHCHTAMQAFQGCEINHSNTSIVRTWHLDREPGGSVAALPKRGAAPQKSPAPRVSPTRNSR